MQEFKPEFLQSLLYMENSSLFTVNTENEGNTVTYYIGNPFVDPTHIVVLGTQR